jgi:hypothetical protein
MGNRRFIFPAIILLLIFPPVSFGQDATTQATSGYQEAVDIDKDIVDKCKEEARVGCDKMCADGFGQDCYFDSTRYNKAELKSGEVLPKETKAACFAIRSYSECGNCYKKFELRKGDEFKEVTCEEFYRVIKEKNKACNNCVDIIYAGCC